MSDNSRPIGYGNPPKWSQVKPGQRLPGGGRPKGSKNKKTLAQRYLKIADEAISVTERGKAVKRPSVDLAIKKFRNLALTKDDAKTIDRFIDRYQELEKAAAAAGPAGYPFTDLDRQVVHEMHKRMKACEGENNG